MNKEQYKELLIDMLKDTPELLSGYDQEIIYNIDGINVYGALNMDPEAWIITFYYLKA